MNKDSLKTTIYDLATGEVTVRDLTPEEIAQYNKDQQDYEAKKAAEAAKIAEKTALLERLGITADEAALLLS